MLSEQKSYTYITFGLGVFIIGILCFVNKDTLYFTQDTFFQLLKKNNFDNKQFADCKEENIATECQNDDLFHKVKVLCWIMTYPGNHKKLAVHVKQTWGKRCNVLLFASDHYDKDLPSINISVTPGYNKLAEKTVAAFEYIYKHHFNDVDWFLKADDDTYVIMENLRYFLSRKNTTGNEYYGYYYCRDNCSVRGFMSGGAGYVVGKEALQRFVNRRGKVCPILKAEDLTWTRCMKELGIKWSHSKDYSDRSLFHSGYPTGVIWDPVKAATRSPHLITFHRMKAQDMYTMEFLLYNLTLGQKGCKQKT